MPKRASTPTPTKASESVVSATLAKILAVAVGGDVEDVCLAYSDDATNPHLSRLLRSVVGLYPWVTAVARDVMSRETTPFTEHLMATPGSAYVVKDSERSGADALWLAIGDPSLIQLTDLTEMEHRGLTRSFRLPDGDVSHIIAIQLNSCRP